MLRLLSLDLKNIGPFEEAHVDFASEHAPRVTIFTGENGTGKSILIDAIRVAFGEQYGEPERDLVRQQPFRIDLCASLDGAKNHILREGYPLSQGGGPLHALPTRVEQGAAPWFVVDFWSSKVSPGSYQIDGLRRIEHKNFLFKALQGEQPNEDVTAFLASFDYLRSSSIADEARVGDILYEKARRIVELSLLGGGRLVGIRRADFTPIIEQAGARVPIENLSSGNAYLIQRMISLLGKMYSFQVLAGTPPEEIGNTPGVLLIDEAENHLHPKWQKRFLRNILDVFPNLQIIAATHSPFIVASMPGAKVYACKYDPARQACHVEEEREDVSNQPVDEILLSPVFDETVPFNEEITGLLQARSEAIKLGNGAEKLRIEARLIGLNPHYFSYFKIEDAMKDVFGEKS